MIIDQLDVTFGAFCWFVVAGGALIAVYHPSVHDTLSERIGLAWVSVTAFATGCRVIAAGVMTEGGFWLATGMAFYVASIFWKKWKRLDGHTPHDKAHA